MKFCQNRKFFIVSYFLNSFEFFADFSAGPNLPERDGVERIGDFHGMVDEPGTEHVGDAAGGDRAEIARFSTIERPRTRIFVGRSEAGPMVHGDRRIGLVQGESDRQEPNARANDGSA